MRLLTSLAFGSIAVLCICATACNGAPPTKDEAKKTPAKPAAASRSAPAAEAEAPVGKDASAAAEKKAPAAAAEAVAAAQPALADETPEQLYAPKVTLSTAHGAAALVKVGDKFPSLTVNDFDGKPVSIASLLGPKITVVLFWSDKWLYAREQFRRFGPEVAARYGHLGVKTVAINVGDSSDLVKKLAGELKVDYPCLVDTDQKAFAQVAKEGLPRIYVLDAQGKVLWFDLEYSRPMRRELHNAVHYFTATGKPAKVN